MIRVLIADDHAVVREGLKRIVAQNADMSVVGEAGTGHEVLAFVQSRECDLVLLDLSMPGKDGLDTLKELRALKPHLPVLILSVYPEDQYAVRLLRAGASGYLTKESAPEELVAAVRKVSRRGRYVSASLAERLASMLDSSEDRPPHERLSDREYPRDDHDCLGPDRRRDRRQPLPEREDRQHLPCEGAREAQHEDQRRVRLLRHEAGAARLAAAGCRTNTDILRGEPSYARIVTPPTDGPALPA